MTGDPESVLTSVCPYSRPALGSVSTNRKAVNLLELDVSTDYLYPDIISGLPTLREHDSHQE